MNYLYKFLISTLKEVSLPDVFIKPLSAFICIIVLILISWIAHKITRKILIGIAQRVSQRTKTEWDDILVANNVFRAVSHIVPALIIYTNAGFSYPDIHAGVQSLSNELYTILSKDYYFQLKDIITNVAQIYFIIIVIYISNTFLNAVLDIYNRSEFATNRPIKGYLQLIKIIIFTLSGVAILSILIQKNPVAILGGFGAMAAVLMLIFKDTILGFVASIQLSANNMIALNDWISMPSRNADGVVADISLNTVKVQNWDNTISTIPTYALVSESFNNWKGMTDSGGRRIKRSILINLSTIKFCSEEMLERFKNFKIIHDYVVKTQEEVIAYNKSKNIDEKDLISGRRQTNVGVFRKYIHEYLKQHPYINHNMTFMVRHLPTTEKGLPMEIYVFSKDKRWVQYEAIQADIFDHILAVLPEFDLRAFQLPTGYDFEKLKIANEASKS